MLHLAHKTHAGTSGHPVSVCSWNACSWGSISFLGKYLLPLKTVISSYMERNPVAILTLHWKSELTISFKNYQRREAEAPCSPAWVGVDGLLHLFSEWMRLLHKYSGLWAHFFPRLWLHTELDENHMTFPCKVNVEPNLNWIQFLSNLVHSQKRGKN